ncbi:hypothetical protein [Bartonella rattaustraliani]|uniref:hypothetical protein n=1 Tax=Bartonella rattaustraliani TaxID=481139 RepID=UPI0002F993BA
MGMVKENDGADFSLHGRKDGGAQWLGLYLYIFYPCHREMGLRAVSLKQARECVVRWRFVAQRIGL